MFDTLKYNTIAYTTAGRRHLSLGKENEDNFSIYEDEKILVLAVADGCSDSPCAKAAADATLKALIEFGRNTDIFEMQPKEVKSNVIRFIDKYLLAEPYEYSLLACTCAAIVTNKISKKYCAISIGDCRANVITEKLEPKRLLIPVNILRNREYTVFANSSVAMNWMKVESGSVSTNIAGYVLVTDGADRLCDFSGYEELTKLSAACVLSKEYAQAALENYIADSIAPSTNDDITVVMAMRCDDRQITTTAQTKCNIDIDVEEDDDSFVEDKVDEEQTDADADSSDNKMPSLLTFLQIPRTAEELILAGYCTPSEVITYIFPLIKEGIVDYNDYRFTLSGGGAM